ncbi:helix-turn-helix domain-containing protein [Liquorilactobacillus uvarum]|uniref:helix-turn-helix domain-containing protein n=1 Tax=Liquorilactobacillus uvarum TaxID=303240 RepID=UPI002888FB32|nr:helix-turn-helix transcriptional regulator [Liquorilactobacillus uvarum]
MVNDNFSLNLKMIRKQRLLTQQSVAEKLHVSRKTISSWETGHNLPDIEKLTKLAEFYEISTDELLGRKRLHSKQPRSEDSTLLITVALTILLTGRLIVAMSTNTIVLIDILIGVVLCILILEKKKVLRSIRLASLFLSFCFSCSVGLINVFSISFSLRVVCLLSSAMLFSQFFFILKFSRSLKIKYLMHKGGRV